uniref:Invasin family protein n=1 Tax=Providencia stuartii TaxID=588 RepID=A0AAI9GHQ1_PROST|nr:invasin family protein [Providencia stuartii]
MINHKQQTPNTHKVKLSVLIAGAVLCMAVSTPTLAAAAKTTTVSVTSAATTAVIGHAPVMKTAGKVTAKDENGDKVLGEGDTLTVSGFDFEDADGDKFTISYEWHDGTKVISGTTGDKLTLTKDMVGKTITVKAIARTDSAFTEPAESKLMAATTYVDIAGATVAGDKGIPTVSGSVVKSVTISGKAEVNEMLTATAACHGTCDGSVTYQWQIEDAAGSGKYADISGATTKDYTVKNTDQKRKIKVIASSK